jgi:hypothetical protein
MMESRTRRFLRIRACSPAAGSTSSGSKNFKARSRRRAVQAANATCWWLPHITIYIVIHNPITILTVGHLTPRSIPSTVLTISLSNRL